jgi:hypothetical protein
MPRRALCWKEKSKGHTLINRRGLIACRGPRDTGPNIAPPWAGRSAEPDPVSGEPHPDRLVPNTAYRYRAEAPGLLARDVAAQVLQRSCANMFIIPPSIAPRLIFEPPRILGIDDRIQCTDD